MTPEQHAQIDYFWSLRIHSEDSANAERLRAFEASKDFLRLATTHRNREPESNVVRLVRA